MARTVGAPQPARPARDVVRRLQEIVPTAESRHWFTIAQLCDRWQLHRKTVYKFIDAGLLPAWRLGPHLYRVAARDVQRFESAQRLNRRDL